MKDSKRKSYKKTRFGNGTEEELMQGEREQTKKNLIKKMQ